MNEIKSHGNDEITATFKTEPIYDPDKRIERNPNRIITIKVDYDPDERVECPKNNGELSSNGKEYNPDDRIVVFEDNNDNLLDAYVNDVGDDNGNKYCTEDVGWIPNNTYVLDGITYKTDDNGNIYSIDGKLQPNMTYELNGNLYTTDEKGRIISCEAKPVRSPENSRDNEAQRQAGGEDRRPNDQGGHIVGRDMNGDGDIGNLVAMDSKINQSDYKRMENDIKTALDERKDVTTKTEMTYSGDSERPDKITVTVTADGKDTVYKFDNNLDGSIRDEVPENEKETIQDRLDETGGEISSIKEEYDAEGNLVETTFYITYKGEDGTNYRTSVVIENQ